MAEGYATRTVSRSAFLELREEEKLVNSGYEFLDEKRVQLAAEMLRQREAYREARARFLAACEQASAALVEAASAEGLEALQLLPAMPLGDARTLIDERKFVGLTLLAARFEADDEHGGNLAAKNGVVRDCSHAFREVVSLGVPLAALAASLERLMHEYQRTERRVRALENVILPEIRDELATMEEHVDLNEQEEVIRVRSIRQD